MSSDAKERKVITGKDWKEITVSDEKLLAELTDDERYFPDNDRGSTTRPLNLGIYLSEGNDKKTVLRCSAFIGAVPLIGSEIVKEDDSDTKRFIKTVKEGVSLIVASRFTISPLEMMRMVMDGDEYWNDPELFHIKHYTADEWKKNPKINTNNAEKKVLFGQIDGFAEIDVKEAEDSASEDGIINLANTIGLFETLDFIQKAKDICKRSLMKKTQRVEENLVCKVKGRIVVNKQIKYNLAKGQQHKCYCSYNKMNDNNKENQIIKYALYLCQKCEDIPEVIKEDISACMSALGGVALKKCSASDFAGLKNNSAYRAYKEALQSAKKIITRYSINYDSKTHTTTTKLNNYKVKPFFIDMNVLVELYCRAVVSKAVKDKELMDKGLSLVSVKDSKKKLYDSDDEIIKGAFMQNYIPDIIIAKGDKAEPFIVLDAKNSDVTNQSTDARRERTHQVNFYMNALNVKIGGLISPSNENDASDAVMAKLAGLNKYLAFVPLSTSGKSDIHVKTVTDFIKKATELSENKKGKGGKNE